MNDSATIIFIVFILVFPWLFAFIYIFAVNRTIVKNYKSFGDKYGFEVDTTGKSGFFRHPVSRGIYRNIPVIIGTFLKDNGKKKSAATFIEVDCLNPVNFEFLIVKKNSVNRNKYGGKAITVSDSEFDDKFIVNTNDMDRMFNLLNFSIKYKLIQSLNVGFNGIMFLDKNKIRYEEKELLKNSVNMLRTEILLHLLCEIADELKEYNP